MVPKGPRLGRVTNRSKVGKEYINVQGWPRIPKGVRLVKGA